MVPSPPPTLPRQSLCTPVTHAFEFFACFLFMVIFNVFIQLPRVIASAITDAEELGTDPDSSPLAGPAKSFSHFSFPSEKSHLLTRRWCWLLVVARRAMRFLTRPVHTHRSPGSTGQACGAALVHMVSLPKLVVVLCFSVC